MTMILREPTFAEKSAMIAVPAALLYLGGPVAVWAYSGLAIRSIIVITAIPTMIEGAKVVKGTVKVVARVFMIIIGKKNEGETTHSQELIVELKDTGAHTARLLLPSSVSESIPARMANMVYKVMSYTVRSIGWLFGRT